MEIIQTPLSYYSPKLKGFRNWSGTYKDIQLNYTKDTNFKFALKVISDSVVLVELPNRADTLKYFWTEEIAKTIWFAGSTYRNSNPYYFSFNLKYNYAEDHLVYEEHYIDNSYKYGKTISYMILRSL